MAKAEFTYTRANVRCIRVSTSGLAILCKQGDKTFWVPKSVIHDDSEIWDKVGQEGKLIVQAWFAEKEGWYKPAAKDEEEPEPMDAVDGLKAINRRFGR